MNISVRWIFTLLCTVALACTASAQDNASVTGDANVLANASIQHVERTVLGEDVVHYRFDVTVGPGKFERIRLHRIVREKYPWQPIHTVTGVLLLPGNPNSFEGIFMEPLISPVPAWDQSITAFLAKNNIDVWGIDYRWSLVPAKTKNFKFMKQWGLQTDIDDAKIALALARLVRGSTGQGFGKMHLLGFSWGVFVTYAIGNQETQLPHSLRNVKGLIPVDYGMVFSADDPFRAEACGYIEQDQALYDAGVYNYDNTFLKQVGDLARSAPDDPSPFAEGFTNYQFALLVGGSPAHPDDWHFVGVTYDEAGIPTGLEYTDPWVWIDLLRTVPPYAPVLSGLDADKVGCYDVVAPFDDHLGEIVLPVLYVGARGGSGEHGYYTLDLLTASSDINKFTVQLHPDNERALDFGHADLFTATNAETLVWQPILDWLVAHR